MIIKINRVSRTGKIWENYIYLPDTYSFRTAVEHIKQSKGVTCSRKRTTFVRVFDEANFTKPLKRFDFSLNRYRPAR